MKRGIYRLEFWFCLELKNIASKKDIMPMFMKPQSLIVNAYGGTFSNSKSYVLLPKHGRSIDCGMDTNCLNEAIPQLSLTYARQMISRESDVDREEKFCSCAKPCAREIALIDMENVWIYEKDNNVPCTSSRHKCHTIRVLISVPKSCSKWQ